MSQIYCSNCGQLIPHSANFCTYCGVPQHGANAGVFRAQDPTLEPGQMPLEPTSSQKDTIPKSRLSPTVIFIFFLNYFKITFLLFVLLIVGAYLMPEVFILVTGLAILSLAGLAVWAYGSFVYEVTEDGLEIEFGIVHQKTISVPFSQVQNVNIERSLVDRMLNLARISIETAGSTVTQPIQVIGGYTARSEAYLPGLTLEQAKQLHDILIDGKLDEEK